MCEFVFPENTEWDSAIPGLIYTEAKERFPIREQRSETFIGCSTTSDVQPEIKRGDITHFLNEGKNAFIRVGPRSISLNQLKPYSNWGEFKNNVDYIFSITKKLIKFDSMQRIGLQYTNLIEMPNEEIDLENYFEIRPFLGKRLPQRTTSFITGCIFLFSDERDACRVQLTDTISQNEKSLAFVLKIDYLLAEPRSIPVDQTLKWIEQAHENTENIFEGCILDSLRDLFGVVR